MNSEPDFTSIRVEKATLPYREEPYLQLSYQQDILFGYSVYIIADSIPESTSPNAGEGYRLVTLIGRFPRSVLSEINTHRVFSRNSASSRARSFKTTVADVMKNPFIPLFSRNQRGMSGKFLDENTRERAIVQWLRSRDEAVASLFQLLLDQVIAGESTPWIIAHYEELVDVYENTVYRTDTPDPRALSIHKQDVNRVIEPYMWHEAIISSTFWDNFLSLRTDEDHTHPSVVALAKLVERGLQLSEPQSVRFHVPFVEKVLQTSNIHSLKSELLYSAAEAARISYNDRSTANKAVNTTKIAETMLALKHMSPFEHVAIDPAVLSGDFGGNFGPHWTQLRRVLEEGKDF